jgi:hypothetical protein
MLLNAADDSQTSLYQFHLIFSAHYMEDSIAKYLQVCQLPEFAVRATLFDALCLKYHGM